MNLLRPTLLNQSGFDHVFGAALCFVFVGLVGSFMLVTGHAATAHWKGILEEGGAASGYCLSTEGGTNGSKVSLNSCSGSSSTAQNWSLNYIKQASVLGSSNVEEFTLQSADGSSECLNDPYSAKTNGTQLQLYTCSSSAQNGLWVWGGQIKNKGLTYHQLINVATINGNSAMCIDDAYGNHTANNKVQLWSCKTSGQTNQTWFEASKVGTTGGGSTTGEHIIATLYADPTSAPTLWSQVESAAPTVKYDIVDICAPDGTGSGCGKPADEKNPAWTSTVAALKGKGITPLYYISSNYGSVPLATLESEIKDAISWYGIANPMFDEMADTGNCSGIPCPTYYKDLYTYAVNAGASTVMYNPGTITTSSYMFGPKELLMIFEGTAADFNNTTFPSWMVNYPSSQFVTTLSVGTSSSVNTDISHAIKSHIGNFYEDDESEPPSYATLPSYWSAEVQDVKMGQ